MRTAEDVRTNPMPGDRLIEHGEEYLIISNDGVNVADECISGPNKGQHENRLGFWVNWASDRRRVKVPSVAREAPDAR